ncbi:MAG: inositol monophosphatase family protein [Anaerolineae bacterium]
MPHTSSHALWDEMLALAEEAARQAGEELRRRLSLPHTVTSKGLRDLVTEADVVAERLILERIRQRFPAHGVVSEESAPDLTFGDGTCWAVDPLDGTSNFARGLPLFSVSVAALQGRQPVVGVIYEPMAHRTFRARRGGGAWLDGAPARVSRVDYLLSAMVALDWGRAQGDRLRLLDQVQRLGPKVGVFRTLGSAALGLAYVAVGWLDAYFHLALGPWDTAAGVLLVEEAGGRVTQADGSPWTPEATSILASNGALHDQLLDCLLP